MPSKSLAIESVFTAEDLPEFTAFSVLLSFVTEDGALRVHGSSDGITTLQTDVSATKRIQARRQSDGAMLFAEIIIYLNEEKAKSYFCKGRVSSTAVQRISGSRSGHPVGAESYFYKSALSLHLPRHRYTLTARRGRCLVEIGLRHPPAQGTAHGTTEAPKTEAQSRLTPDDITFVEKLAATILENLATLGCGE